VLKKNIVLYDVKYNFQSNLGSNLSRIGASITRRTGRNGQISLSTNKRRIPHNGNKIQERTVTSGGRGFGIAASEMDVDAHIGEGILHNTFLVIYNITSSL
jgi:hypothetical protein